ncbi:MAG: hypothetical protein IPG75_07580 [Gemmatimonadetes bacterium]|nr:hypothetical protein [Gemmatimonadota bacterium]
MSSRFSTSLAANWRRNRDDLQYFGTFADSSGVAHYTFAHLQQRTLSLTWRLGYTFSPTTSLQVYASPFITKGSYSRVREVARARAARYADRYQPYGDTTVTSDPGGFNFQQFRSNVVFRWEYRPGSTLFVVWSQGREGLRAGAGAGVLRRRPRRPLQPPRQRHLPGQALLLVLAVAAGAPLPGRGFAGRVAAPDTASPRSDGRSPTPRDWIPALDGRGHLSYITKRL